MSSTVTSAGTGASTGPTDGSEPPGESKSSLAGLLDVPGNTLRRILRSTASTPGRLSVIAVGLVLLTVLTGVVGTVAAATKKNTIDGLIDHREPLAAAAQQAYRSLSDADATASSSFLATGTEPAQLRERYARDIARAGAAVAKAASDSAGVVAAANQVDVLNQQLPVYTGLVETARANNRQGYPVGASYLREASELMRAQILPAAQHLYDVDTQRLAAEQDDATDFPWLSTLLLLVLLGALIATQLYLTRKTNRLLNIGLLVATAAMSVVLVWGVAALTVQSVLVSSGNREGTEQVDVLVKTRIAALQARTDETMTLVARGTGGSYEQEFTQLAGTFAGSDGQGGLLLQAKGLASEQESAERVESAANNARGWLSAHRDVRSLDDSGTYEAAVSVAIDTNNPNSAAAAFSRLDRDLAGAIEVGRQGFLDDTTNASRALTLLAPGIALLSFVAIVGTMMGIRQRLREYR